MKIAVIGGGIAGNVAAYHLSREHRVTLFEAGDHLGGHTHTHDIEWEGRRYAVDTGFIVFNDRTYPNFIKLLHELGVAYQPTEMSFSVKCDRGGLEYNGHSLNTLFAQRRNLVRPSFLRMIREILRFNREAPKSLEDGTADIPLGDYLQSHRYSAEFRDHYIVPMGAAIWSTDPTLMRQFPARFFIRFFVNHGPAVVRNQRGVQAISETLVGPLRRSHSPEHPGGIGDPPAGPREGPNPGIRHREIRCRVHRRP